ncbi:MAG: hypothetical protein U1F43_15870 [Myxococcota bacterium]
MPLTSNLSRRPLVHARRAAQIALAVALAASACGGSKSSSGPCAPRLERDLAAIEGIHSDGRSAATAAAVVEQCRDPAHPLPKGLGDALTRYAQTGGQGGIADVAVGVSDLMLEAPDLWATACGKSAVEVAHALQAMAATGSGDGFLAACPLGALGFAGAAELATVPPATLMLSGLTYAWLVREGAAIAVAGRIARAIAGL